ncbi:hypothetical protein DFH07DRAFT_783062 [Mycena maculata]|uniref:Uncharacterized protein n=1 Tax=Mycena maculata TaxID=230809 RepID=A0AAD7MNK0_9AGAR|nr:hypothetical protein DFH07DRAFT_783062 [Mycena maculata]
MCPSLMAQMDKSPFGRDLTIQVLKALQGTPIDNLLITGVIQTTARLGRGIFGQRQDWTLDIQKEIYQFCSSFPRGPGWLDVVISATMLVRVDDIEALESLPHMGTEGESQQVDRIYLALEHVQNMWEATRESGGPDEWDTVTTAVIDGLLRSLVGTGPLSEPPPPKALRIILRALPLPGDMSTTAFLILYNARPWFVHPSLQPILQEYLVWSHLGSISRKNKSHLGWRYLEMVFSRGNVWEGKANVREKFISVIRTVWVPDFDEHYKFTDIAEMSWALGFAALANVWETFEFTHYNSSMVTEILFGRKETRRVFPVLAGPPSSTALQLQHGHRDFIWQKGDPKSLPSPCWTTFSSELGTSLAQAATNARNTFIGLDLVSENGHPLKRVAEFLDTLDAIIGTDPGSGEVDIGGATKTYKNWKELRSYFMAELDSVEESLGG